MAIRSAFFIAVSAIALMYGTTLSAQRTMNLDADNVDFVLGNFEFALLHELAHVAIRDLEIPIVGPEEQAADYVAAMSLISPLQIPPVGDENWLGYAMNAANAFVILWQIAEEAEAILPFWDSHGLSIQRFYSVTCLLYGSDPERFSDLPEAIAMPEQRAEGCPDEYSRTRKSIDWLREYANAENQNAQPAAITLRFEEPRTRISQLLTEAIRDRGLAEWTLRRFAELITVREEIQVVFRQCGMPEAAWQPDRRELVICFELLDFYYALSPMQARIGIVPALRQ